MLWIPEVGADGLRRYGKWSGNERGTVEDTALCVAEVCTGGAWIPWQCTRKRGKGPDGLYCGQHAKAADRRVS